MLKSRSLLAGGYWLLARFSSLGSWRCLVLKVAVMGEFFLFLVKRKNQRPPQVSFFQSSQRPQFLALLAAPGKAQSRGCTSQARTPSFTQNFWVSHVQGGRPMRPGLPSAAGVLLQSWLVGSPRPVLSREQPALCHQHPRSICALLVFLNETK